MARAPAPLVSRLNAHSFKRETYPPDTAPQVLQMMRVGQGLAAEAASEIERLQKELSNALGRKKTAATVFEAQAENVGRVIARLVETAVEEYHRRNPK